MKRLACSMTASICLLVASAGVGLAASNPSGTGQPSQTCLSSTAPNEPGNAAGSPGAPFNEVNGTAGGVYAGNGQTTNTPANGHAVSQYDVACYQQPS